jgi:hypothetical protein
MHNSYKNTAIMYQLIFFPHQQYAALDAMEEIVPLLGCVIALKDGTETQLDATMV